MNLLKNKQKRKKKFRKKQAFLTIQKKLEELKKKTTLQTFTFQFLNNHVIIDKKINK